MHKYALSANAIVDSDRHLHMALWKVRCDSCSIYWCTNTLTITQGSICLKPNITFAVEASWSVHTMTVGSTHTCTSGTLIDIYSRNDPTNKTELNMCVDIAISANHAQISNSQAVNDQKYCNMHQGNLLIN